jgi:hypothetical protein
MLPNGSPACIDQTGNPVFTEPAKIVNGCDGSPHASACVAGLNVMPPLDLRTDAQIERDRERIGTAIDIGLATFGGVGIVRYGLKKTVKNACEIENVVDKTSIEKELSHLRRVESELRTQLANGRRQAVQEIADGRIPNPHGLGKEIDTLIPREIDNVLKRINEINRLLGK